MQKTTMNTVTNSVMTINEKSLAFSRITYLFPKIQFVVFKILTKRDLENFKLEFKSCLEKLEEVFEFKHKNIHVILEYSEKLEKVISEISQNSKLHLVKTEDLEDYILDLTLGYYCNYNLKNVNYIIGDCICETELLIENISKITNTKITDININNFNNRIKDKKNIFFTNAYDVFIKITGADQITKEKVNNLLGYNYKKLFIFLYKLQTSNKKYFIINDYFINNLDTYILRNLMNYLKSFEDKTFFITSFYRSTNKDVSNIFLDYKGETNNV